MPHLFRNSVIASWCVLLAITYLYAAIRFAGAFTELGIFNSVSIPTHLLVMLTASCGIFALIALRYYRALWGVIGTQLLLVLSYGLTTPMVSTIQGLIIVLITGLILHWHRRSRKADIWPNPAEDLV